MNGQDFIALAPWLVLAGTAIAVLIGLIVHRSRALAVGTTCGGLLLAGLAIVPAIGVAPHEVGPLLVVDSFSLLLTGVFVVGALVLSIVAAGYLDRRGIDDPEEFQVILLLALVGACVLTGARHFVSLFLGIELLSLGLYVLAAYAHDDGRSLEAGLKYLVLAGVSSAFLVFGFAFVYGSTGSMDLATDAAALVDGGLAIHAGFALVLVAFGFKLALVPFQIWAADVYEGAPAPATAFLATISKAAVIAVLFRYAADADGARSAGVMIGTLAGASMVGGSLLALLQRKIKRVLAGSSISHVGYLLVGVLAAAGGRGGAGVFYLVAYVLSVLLALSIVSVLSGGTEADLVTGFRGLARRKPFLGVGLVVALLSLAGLPVTAGFFGKLVVVLAGVRGDFIGLVILLVATSVLGLFYYLRIVAEVVASPSPDGPDAGEPPLPVVRWYDMVLVGALATLIVVLGAFPSPLIEAAAAALGGP